MLTVSGSLSHLWIGKISSHHQHHFLYKYVHSHALISKMIIWMFKHTGPGKEGENCSIKWWAIGDIRNFTSSDGNTGFVELDKTGWCLSTGYVIINQQDWRDKLRGDRSLGDTLKGCERDRSDCFKVEPGWIDQMRCVMGINCKIVMRGKIACY